MKKKEKKRKRTGKCAIFTFHQMPSNQMPSKLAITKKKKSLTKFESQSWAEVTSRL